MLRSLFFNQILKYGRNAVRCASQQSFSILDDIEQRRSSAKLGGGKKRIEAQHKKVLVDFSSTFIC